MSDAARKDNKDKEPAIFLHAIERRYPQGAATLGVIGFEGRWDYGAIGPVSNLAARLSSEAKAGQILVSRTLLKAVDRIVTAEPVGELTLKGFAKPVSAYNVLGLRDT